MGMYGKTGRPVVDCSNDKKLTVQSERTMANINSIIKRIEKGAMVQNLESGTPFYGDVSEYTGLQDAQIKVQNANEMFMEMSAEIRKKFDNDPVKMVDFLLDENNRKEAEDLGMVLKRPEPASEPPKTPVEPSPPGE